MAAKSSKLFQKRKARTKNDLKRKDATRRPIKRILVVSEGEVTEPSYFEAFKTFAKLVNVDVDVCGKECDSAPKSVVNFAERRANTEGHFNSGGYDEVYCVIDRDTHETFHWALSRIRALNKCPTFLAGKIEAIASYPCFEIWLLFHFSSTRTPFVATKNKSPAGAVASALQHASPEFASYDKKLTPEMLACLFQSIETAFVNAKMAELDRKATGEENPSTTVHGLLETLKESNRIVRK